MISLVIIGYAWSFILDQRNGILNYFLSFVGIPNIEWFSPELALLSIVIMFAWWLIGYCAMLFTAGMQSIPGEYYEACRLDGASTLDCLRFITIPLLRPIMMFVILMIILFSFQTFVLIFNTTGGGPSNATNLYIFHLYRVAFLHLNPGYASALTFLGMTIIIGMAIIIFKKMDIKFEY
jgi:ABC-type sugar transport system permease subunit